MYNIRMKSRKLGKVKVTLTLREENYNNFRKLCEGMGLSVSSALDIIIYFILKYGDNLDKYIKEDLFDKVLDDLKGLIEVKD
ncbi:hypothetical protein JCM13304A_24810 [Desulfothermus okinawensis JCM 13304]